MLRPGDPQFAAAVEGLQRAGFPRPPSTFSLGRNHYVPGETDAKLTVRTSAGEQSITCFAHAWGDDPGYLRFLESLHPPKPRPPSWKLTMPASAEELEMSFKWGSPYTTGHHWFGIIRSRKVSYSIEVDGGRARAASEALTDVDASALLAAVAAIEWREGAPPFDPLAAARGHTPARIQLRPGRNDESYANQALAWEQRHAAPEWSRLFTVLDAMVARLTPALR